ncbi:oxidoreductase [Agromyces bauzanensis]|uniref:Short-chain dehydrogenase/reductase n=1 Tax=Agromyces bauzanensis TaxID=1308924 RepID=A0A917USY3_9MICO|nr:oxidoreductase [Agromyces bauzanensis]GGJ83001.1 short-chain dehydrogenase/reductase [Agromyces bauzanensis]
MEQQVALVTGASSGIGEQTALELLRHGFVVYGAARRADRMAAIVGAGGHAIAMDVTDDASMRAGVEQILAAHGRIDVLVNNAGYGSYGALEDVPIDEARRQFEVNVFGLARLTQLVLPGMRARRSGTIVNISSIGGRIYEPLGAWYHATKFAVEGLSDSLRVELEPHGIRVVVIQPGAIRTEWSAISRRSAIERSGSTAYAAQARALVRALEAADRSTGATEPHVVAATIAKAAGARRPRTRYATPLSAKVIVGLRRVLPDRAVDRVIRSVFSPTKEELAEAQHAEAPHADDVDRTGV